MKLRLSLIAMMSVTLLEATTLKEAIQKGVQNDPQIQAQIESYKKTSVSVSYAQSDYYPKLDLSAGIGKEKTRREQQHGAAPTDTDYTRKEAALKFRQPIFEGMKTSNEVDSVKAEKKVAEYELQTLYENKSLKIVQAYMDVLKSEAIIKAAEENLETHKEILAHIDQRYKQGVSNKADLLQIKGRVAGAKTDLLSSRNNAVDAHEYYLKAVGELPSDLQMPDQNVSLPASKEGAVQTAVASSPTILTAKQKVESTQYKKNTFKGDYYPHFYLDALAQYQDNAEGVDGYYDKGQAMLRMEWNLFNGARNKNQVEIAQQDVLSAKSNSDETRREVVLETGLSYNAYQLLQEQIEPLTDHVSYAQEVKKIYADQYNVGRRTLVDVLNAQVEYFNAYKALLNAQYDETTARYRVLTSMGTLNSTIGVETYTPAE